MINHHPNDDSYEEEGDRLEIVKRYNYAEQVVDQVQGIKEKHAARITTPAEAWMSGIVGAGGLSLIHT